MTLLAALGLFVVGFATGFFWGYRIRAKRDGAAWELAARYKYQADEMMERLIELDNQLQGE